MGRLQAGDHVHEAATALQSYSCTLTWAQGQAAEAIRQWQEAEAATDRVMAGHAGAVHDADRDLPFDDPDLAGRDAAQHTLGRARTQLDEAGVRAAATVRAARDQAPNSPGFLEEFADGASDVVGAIGAWFSAHGDELGSALQHGGETALGALGMLGGGATVAAGFGGEIGGTVVAATGLGAPVGVPVDIASAGVITAGSALVAGGAGLAADGVQGLAHDTNRMFSDSGGHRYYPPPKGKSLPNVPGAARAKPNVLDPDTGEPIPGKGSESGREVEP